MNILIFGPNGSGKGTQGAVVQKKYNVTHVESGVIFRENIKKGTEIGKKAKEFIDRGELVPARITIPMIISRLQEPDCVKGFILDGFPRTIAQAEALKVLLKKLNQKLDMVVNLEVPRDVILDRLTTRRTCSNPSCQAIYNVKSMPPAADGTCTKCGSKVVQRDDETETAILFRLETYNQKTAPLIVFYEKEGLLKNFTSLSSADTVEAVKKALKKG